MKYKRSICAIVLLALGSSTAQVASHAPTNVAKAVPASTAAAPKVTGKPVARVNGVVLTDRDLLREEYAIFPYARQHGGAIPADMEPGIRQGAMQMIVFEELAYQEAKKKGMTVPPERLNKAVAEFRKQFSSANEYQQYLKVEFQGKEQLLRDQIKRSILIDQYLQAEVTSKAVVSMADLKSYYDKNPDKFAYPESFAIQTISIIPPEKATPAQLKEARKRADDAFTQTKATKNYEDFGLLAEKISEDDYRVMMGDHKWVERSKMPPEMLAPALKMKDGDTSELIQVGQIYVIFRLNKHVPAGKEKFDDVKVKLRVEMEKNKTNEVRAALGKKLRQNAKIETL